MGKMSKKKENVLDDKDLFNILKEEGEKLDKEIEKIARKMYEEEFGKEHDE